MVSGLRDSVVGSLVGGWSGVGEGCPAGLVIVVGGLVGGESGAGWSGDGEGWAIG